MANDNKQPTLEEQLASLKEELAAEKAAHLQTQQVNADLSAQIEELEKSAASAAETKPAKVEKPKIPTETFKAKDADGVVTEFAFIIPAFNYNGTTITAEQALQNKEILADLVKIGFGGIKRSGEK